MAREKATKHKDHDSKVIKARVNAATHQQLMLHKAVTGETIESFVTRAIKGTLPKAYRTE
jgi:hypothetical protein